MGWLVGIEPTITGPQPAVLPLHHSHHARLIGLRFGKPQRFSLRCARRLRFAHRTRTEAEQWRKPRENSDFRTLWQDRNQLRKNILIGCFFMVPPGGVEPPSHGLEVRCTIHCATRAESDIRVLSDIADCRKLFCHGGRLHERGGRSFSARRLHHSNTFDPVRRRLHL
jgi:hypothetical protein